MLSKYKPNRFDILVLMVIIIIGAIKLPQPFMGDQALFKVYAANINHGDVLYQDMWDAKQPGIFAFYFIGGKLFGFNEIGIHAFELIYMLAFSMVMIFALKDYFENRIMVSLCVLFTVGIYYGIVDVWHQTQVEGLVGFPIFLTLWFAMEASRSTKNRILYWLASGVAGGIVILFKIVFLPILLCFWLATILDPQNRREKNFLVQFSAMVILGVILPISFILLNSIRHNILGFVTWTFFEFPFKVLNEIKPDMASLRGGLGWFTANFSMLLAFIPFGVFSVSKNRQLRMTIYLVIWLAIGGGLILYQRSWFQYHFLLLLVPIGILAARGVDTIWVLSKQPSSIPVLLKSDIVLAFSLFLLFLPMIAQVAMNGVSLARHGFALTADQQFQYQNELNPYYGWIAKDVAFLNEPGSLPGDILVIGDPLYYHLSGRDPVIRFPFPWFRSLPEQWDELKILLDEKHPPYIFISDETFELVRPQILPCLEGTVEYIERDYRILSRVDTGTWYIRTNK